MVFGQESSDFFKVKLTGRSQNRVLASEVLASETPTEVRHTGFLLSICSIKHFVKAEKNK